MIYALAEHDRHPRPPRDPDMEAIADILEIRRRVLADAGAAHLSPLARLLIEEEIPRLIGVLAKARSGVPAAAAR